MIKYLRPEYIVFLIVMIFYCSLCDYKTSNNSNYHKHLRTQKHIGNSTKKTTDNVKNVQKMSKLLKKNEKTTQNIPKTTQKILENKGNNTNEHYLHKVYPSYTLTNNDFECMYCRKNYSTRSSLTRHSKNCFSKIMAIQQIEQDKNKQIELLKKEQQQKDQEIELLKSQQQLEIEKLKREKEEAINLEKDKQLADKQQAIEIAKSSQNITINNNKTINFLNNHYGEMIAMDTFLKALEHTHQLTLKERKDLLVAYNECGIEVFARNFSYIMKQNCKRQLESQGIEDMKLLPLFCSDGNLRSHKEKQLDGWKTQYDNHSINLMLNISNQQIHASYQQIVPISGRERTKIYKEIKRDNHQNKLLKISEKNI